MENEVTSRQKVIVRTSIIGILANIFLAGVKVAAGLLSHSIAIVLDAVNNLSDALSSIITIIGTKLAGRAPDKRHPLGHGRTEYLTAMIISVIVLYAGVTSFIESVKVILHPQTPEYRTVSLIVVAIGVVIKILLGRYVKSVGERVNSDSLIASGTDATMDSIISASTLVAAIIFLLSGLSLEAWLGAIISIVIIKSGIELLSESISDILGRRPDGDLTKAIKQTICTFEPVHGAYDLILHSYGPDLQVGSVHIEIPDTMRADEIDELMRDIQYKVLREHKVILEGISIYSINTKNDEAARIREKVTELVMNHEYVLSMHGFYLDNKKKTITFDVVLDFAADDRVALYKKICEEVQAAFPEYAFRVSMDSDLSD